MRRRLTPIQEWAHRAVGAAILSGDLVRLPCEACGSARTQAHHDDYLRPLDVRWMCVPCHRRWHHCNTAANVTADPPITVTLRIQRIREYFAKRTSAIGRRRKRGLIVASAAPVADPKC
jgi:hypothetical protein